MLGIIVASIEGQELYERGGRCARSGSKRKLVASACGRDETVLAASVCGGEMVSSGSIELDGLRGSIEHGVVARLE